jgi:AraC-like DNA-binding protein
VSDALSRLLDGVRPRGALFEHAEMSGPWSVRCAGAPLTLVAMVRGRGVVTVDRHDDPEPVALGPGDVAVVVGRPYTVSDPPQGRGEELAPTLLTGTYEVHGSVCDRVLGALPPLLVAPGAAAAVELVAAELAHPRPGRQAVLDRLLDLLLVTALREWFERPGYTAPTGYHAQRDPVVGPALTLMHDDPVHPWTVAELAARCAVSRAAFARRFTRLVGEPPMSYLTCWRLCLAADLLRDTDDTLATIARNVGYANAYALSVAFTRVYGVRPGEHRAAVA